MLNVVPSQCNLFLGLLLTLISFQASHLSIHPPDWTRGSSPGGALKTKSSSGLDSWIVPGWSLKNKEVFRIGLVDRPGTLFRITPHGALKMGRCSKPDQHVLFNFLTQCYYPNKSREPVSPVCGIFLKTNQIELHCFLTNINS